MDNNVFRRYFKSEEDAQAFVESLNKDHYRYEISKIEDDPLVHTFEERPYVVRFWEV